MPILIEKLTGSKRRNPDSLPATVAQASRPILGPHTTTKSRRPARLRRPALGADPSKTAVRLKKLSRLRPTLAIVLGSGFQSAVKELEIDAQIPYSRLPGFAPPAVRGHEGSLLLGRLGGTPVLVLSGRAHFYEGHPMSVVTFPIRVLAAFGIEALLLTNAAGGINAAFRPGHFMILTDHINLMGVNPLRGTPSEPANFTDLTRLYEPGLRQILRRATRICCLAIREGVYVAVSGPSYETPAEIRAFAALGADAVGMSTVPEAIVARRCGLRVAALSCITNLAASSGANPLSHPDVLESGRRVGVLAAQLLKNFARLYGREDSHCERPTA